MYLFQCWVGFWVRSVIFPLCPCYCSPQTHCLSHSGDVSGFYKIEQILLWCDSLNFLDDHGIDLIRPTTECVEGPNQLSVMTEAEVLSALQVGNLSRRNLQFYLQKGHFQTLVKNSHKHELTFFLQFFWVQVILSPQYYPLHVMCNFGHRRTGMQRIFLPLSSLIYMLSKKETCPLIHLP